MKTLVVCHRVPFPPKRGGKIRPFNIIRHLKTAGHRVTVASLARTECERDEASGLSAFCDDLIIETIPDWIAWPRMLAWAPTPRPSSFAYFYASRLARRIRSEILTGSYDLIIVHCSSVAPYVADVVAAGAVSALTLLDFGDMDSQKWREYVHYKRFPISLAYWLEAVKMERSERRLAADFDLCTCTTVAELESLRGLGVRVRTDWFPNGVDAEFFAPAEQPYDQDLVTFVGRMDYYPNQLAVQSFCRDVLPPLRARRPTVRFEIVGADPPDFIRSLGEQPGVRVTGSVPDVRPYVTRAAATVAPLTIARGTQNKILESMAMGVPVVCSIEASRGVDAIPGEHLITASNTQDYVDALCALLESPQLRSRLAASGRARALSNHSWGSSMNRFDRIIEDARTARVTPASS